MNNNNDSGMDNKNKRKQFAEKMLAEADINTKIVFNRTWNYILREWNVLPTEAEIQIVGFTFLKHNKMLNNLPEILRIKYFDKVFNMLLMTLKSETAKDYFKGM